MSKIASEVETRAKHTGCDDASRPAGPGLIYLAEPLINQRQILIEPI